MQPAVPFSGFAGPRSAPLRLGYDGDAAAFWPNPMPHPRTRKKTGISTVAPEHRPVPKSEEPAIRSGPITRAFGAADFWLAARVDWLVWLIVLIGFYLRLKLADGTYFNGDETQIMFPPLQHGLGHVYRESLRLPYGALMSFVLRFMTFFGSSELYFRMPSVIAGALLPYVAYRWVADIFGKGAGFATACILGFSPPLVILSAQVRYYTIHMLLMACSLYCLERAFREKSARWVRLFGIALLLALLTMYMSAWYTAAIGLYALVRISNRELPRRLVWEWAAIQAIGVALLAVGYATHMRQLQGTESERFAKDVWLRPFYYHSDAGNALDFLARATDALFGYLFANSTLGTWMIFVFLLGAGLLLWRKAGAPGTPKTATLSLVLPPIATYAAAMLGLYPYGGSRHDAYLSVFVAAGVAVACAFVTQSRVLLLVLAAVFLVPPWRAAAEHHYLDDFPEASKLDQMDSALEYLRSRVPPPRVLLTDQFGAAMVNYYVCHGAAGQSRNLAPGLIEYGCADDYRIVMLDTWSAEPSRFPAVLAQARQAAKDSFPDPVWVFHMSLNGWTTDPVRRENRGIFGKIGLYRISPP